MARQSNQIHINWGLAVVFTIAFAVATNSLALGLALGVALGIAFAQVNNNQQTEA